MFLFSFLKRVGSRRHTNSHGYPHFSFFISHSLSIRWKSASGGSGNAGTNLGVRKPVGELCWAASSSLSFAGTSLCQPIANLRQAHPPHRVKNEFTGDMKRGWQLSLGHCAKKRRSPTGSQLQTLRSIDRSLGAIGIAESAGDSHQFGNGFRLDLRNSSINFRIAPRRWCTVSTSRCRPSRSRSYHSSGIAAACPQIVSASICSALVSAGSNACHPVTFSYTQLLANTPLKG
jgi:hypothetical protein